tara:strand:+ start:673 stop:1176 length:504 start_codon:yes stop_codon:yes gene_type:complete
MGFNVYLKGRIFTVFLFLLSLFNVGFAQKMPDTKNANINAIRPPIGFDTTSAFNGYLSMQNSAAIMMLQLENSNYIRIVEAIDQDYMDRNKLRLQQKEDIRTNSGSKGKGLTFTFELNGDTFIRKMIFIGNTKKTLWLNITYPKDLEDLLTGPINESIATANIDLLD